MHYSGPGLISPERSRCRYRRGAELGDLPLFATPKPAHAEHSYQSGHQQSVGLRLGNDSGRTNVRPRLVLGTALQGGIILSD